MAAVPLFRCSPDAVAALPSVVERFCALRVLVIGDVMLDSYLEGSTNRLCPEAPVPVVDVVRRIDVPGGAANTAVNLAALGARVQLLSVTGKDDEGRRLQQALIARRVSARGLLRTSERSTLVKLRVLSGDELLVRVDSGSVGPLPDGLEARLRGGLRYWLPRCDAAVVSDYGYGILTPAIRDALVELQARYGRILVVDAKNLPAYCRSAPTAVKPNYTQLLALLGEEPSCGAARVAQAMTAAEQVLACTGARMAAITLDVEGAVVCERGRPPIRTRAVPRPQAQGVGAGDTYAAALTLALAAGAPTSTAAALAAAAAAVAVDKPGTAVCTAGELLRVAGGSRSWPDDALLLDQNEGERG